MRMVGSLAHRLIGFRHVCVIEQGVSISVVVDSSIFNTPAHRLIGFRHGWATSLGFWYL